MNKTPEEQQDYSKIHSVKKHPKVKWKMWDTYFGGFELSKGRFPRLIMKIKQKINNNQQLNF